MLLLGLLLSPLSSLLISADVPHNFSLNFFEQKKNTTLLFL